MENRLKLERMLKSGKWMKVTGVIICLSGLFLPLLSSTAEDLVFCLVMLLILLACGVVLFIFGYRISADKAASIDRLERDGEIDAVLADYKAEATVRLDKKGRAALGTEYIYALGLGRIYKYSDIVWVYITVNRQNGIPASQMLTVCTKDGKKNTLVSDICSSSGTARLNGYISLITNRNPECMTGFSAENAKAYKNAVKEYKASQKITNSISQLLAK